MEIQFLAPLAGAIAVLGVVPLVASIGIILRATRLRSGLGLRSPTRRSRLPVLAALVVVPVLIGLAAAEPVADELAREALELAWTEATPTSEAILRLEQHIRLAGQDGRRHAA